MMRSSTPARCLDISRLMSRVGRGVLTGVDRVELAYLDRLIQQETPVFALCRTAFGYLLLDRLGMNNIAERLHGSKAWGPADFLSRLSRNATPARRAVDGSLRRVSVARSSRRGLGRMLRKQLPEGCTYLNVGHSNLSARVFEAVARVPRARAVVLVHDVIPLDHPEWQRDGTVESFAKRMNVVSKYADLVIYNSRQSQLDGERHFCSMGRIPESVVAHLGVEVAAPTASVPSQIDISRPYFVTVGTIEPRKNHALLLDIWQNFAADLPGNDVPNLYIMGNRGWKNEPVFRRLDDQPPFVHEASGATDSELSAIVQRSNGLLFPSFAEGFGLPPGEAALLGVPVIVGDLPVYREFLGDYPIYASVDDLYLWQKKILGLMRPGISQPTLTLPSWDDHFEKVLSVV